MYQIGNMKNVNYCAFMANSMKFNHEFHSREKMHTLMGLNKRIHSFIHSVKMNKRLIKMV